MHRPQPQHPYDALGRGYRRNRVPDARIARRVVRALGGARHVCNVGAGAGAYEPAAPCVVAVEPSRTMIAQRAPRGRVVRAVAQALPFRDGAFDAALAVLTLHHWPDVRAGLAEMCRIAPLRVVLSFDPECLPDFWLVRDYIPAVVDLDRGRTPSLPQLADALGAQRVESVPVPWDCSDGFLAAYWRRPHRYLDADARASISGLALLPDAVVRAGMRRLAADLESCAWARRNAALLERREMDYGYRLLVSRAPGGVHAQGGAR